MDDRHLKNAILKPFLEWRVDVYKTKGEKNQPCEM